MRIILFFALTLALFFNSCTADKIPDAKGDLELIFKVKYNNNPLVLFENTATGQSNPSSIFFKKIEFFIADIKAQNSANSTTDLSDVGYISMENSLSTSTSETGTSFIIKDVPVGTYEQLNLGVGISDAVNNTVPGNYSSDSPLSIIGNYWESWTSYILCKLEGNITQSDSTITGFLYHAGVNGMYQPRSFTKNFSISSAQTTQLIIHINAEDFFFKSGREIDLINENQTHSGLPTSAAYALAKLSIENFANAFEIQ